MADRSIQPQTKSRPKAANGDPKQIGAPIPGMVTAISASVGSKVAKGDKLLTLEAMKMQTTLYAPANGVVGEILVEVGDSIENKDLLVKMR